MNPTLKALGGTAMPVGAISGETVTNLLTSSVAATTQGLETYWTPENVLNESWPVIESLLLYFEAFLEY